MFNLLNERRNGKFSSWGQVGAELIKTKVGDLGVFVYCFCKSVLKLTQTGNID